MADTGAPWNLPYPLATDLVRDGAQAIEDLAEATATGLSNIPVLAGIGSNVVQTVLSDVFTVSLANGSTTALTGLDATITPSSDDSKILIVYSIVGSSPFTDRSMGVILRRGTTAIGIGDERGSRTRVSSTALGTFTAASSAAGMFLDSPNTDSPVNYNFLLHSASDLGSTQTFVVNRGQSDTNNSIRWTSASSITLIEVAA